MRAVLLWIALAWGAAAAMAGDHHVLHDSPPTVFAGTAGEITLNGRSLYWIDAQGHLPVDEVEALSEDLPWRLRRRDNQTGARGGTVWILFEAALPPTQRWYLEVAASVNNRVQLFHRDSAGQWVRQEAGTDVAVSQWSVAGRLPTFRLATASKPVRYWLRVEDERADFLAPLYLMREDALQSHREREQLVFGGYFGLLALVAVAAFVNGAAFRDKAFLALALYIVLLGFGQLARIGIGAQHLWPEALTWNQKVLATWPGAATAAALWLVKVLTEPARLSRALDLGVWALTAALLAATALNVTIESHGSRTLVLSLTGVALVALLSMVLWGWMESDDAPLGLVATAFVPLIVLALFPLARGLGLAPTNVLTRFGVYFGTLLQLPLLYYALNTRLMARREGQLRAAALSRTDALTGLPHRRAFIERLDTSLAHARGQKQECAVLAVRIANLDAIANEFGKDALEKALVVAASHLRRVTVGHDMAARVGDREFALLLEAPITREQAQSRAQHVVASGLRQVDALPAATLKFHVAVAVLPRPQLDGAGSLQWLLQELEHITPDARKAIRALDSVPAR